MAPFEANCAVCHWVRNLTSHHIHPQEYRSSYPGGPEDIDNPANLVLLCAGCHQAVHDARPYHQLIRDIKTRMRRAPRVKADRDNESFRQSIKDQMIQYAVWERMLEVLTNREACDKIESYRRIIRNIMRLHGAWFIDQNAKRGDEVA